MNVSLKSPPNLITEFFQHAITSILYQRGIYPPEDFSLIKKYNLQLFTILDPEIKAYLHKILKQLNKWLKKNEISKLFLDIMNKDDGVTVERWVFDIINEQQDPNNTDVDHKQIQAIIRQITASVSFLPILETSDNYTFNVLVSYKNNDQDHVPTDWVDLDINEFDNEFDEKVKFKEFKTGDLKVGAGVWYNLEK